MADPWFRQGSAKDQPSGLMIGFVNDFATAWLGAGRAELRV
ncbi:hypothetical protein chiPu_0030535, partial [Chiloscyllium punctatum]|nr:hypothetical protein [Chiloscyllium punctatum]